MSNTEVTCSRILMTGAFSRGLCQAMTAISVAGIIGAIGRIANAEPQTQRADTPAGGRWGAFEGGPEGMVGALAVFGEPGSPASHPVLYAGGRFTRAGGTRAKLIAKWDDGRWSPVGQGLDGESVEALTVFDEDGAGPGQPALYVAGSFNKAGGKKGSSGKNGMSIRIPKTTNDRFPLRLVQRNGLLVGAAPPRRPNARTGRNPRCSRIERRKRRDYTQLPAVSLDPEIPDEP